MLRDADPTSPHFFYRALGNGIAWGWPFSLQGDCRRDRQSFCDRLLALRAFGGQELAATNRV